MGISTVQVLFVVLGTIYSVTCSNWQKGITDQFNAPPADGYTCDYAECRKPQGGPRLFHVRCRSPAGVSPVDHYDCIYRGNPHNCGWYNTHQVQYYRGLANKAGQASNGCFYFKWIWEAKCGEAFKLENIMPQKGGGRHTKQQAQFCIVPTNYLSDNFNQYGTNGTTPVSSSERLGNVGLFVLVKVAFFVVYIFEG